ncbi:hypothetical protein HK100_005445 [Physocladia obscura]|uniref:Heterokaryon incompatibility domain-containing protein n=1 Tax=Physocladia obscura TaxID=109957 RepID=A0AAD5XCB1_9FUNG|nr:hypothetical protein HK100_005445 [Physocladia obscura]
MNTTSNSLVGRAIIDRHGIMNIDSFDGGSYKLTIAEIRANGVTITADLHDISKLREGFEFTAISHMWAGTKITNTQGPDQAGHYWWTVEQPEHASQALLSVLDLLISDKTEKSNAWIWIDLLCLPQARVFTPDVFKSMSTFYGKCKKCIMVVAVDADSGAKWSSDYFDLVQRVSKSEESLQFNEGSIEAIKAVVDLARPSFTSLEAWTGLGRAPYSRVWTFQEMLLPPSLFVAFKIDGGATNCVEIDSFASSFVIAAQALKKFQVFRGLPWIAAPAYEAYNLAVNKILSEVTTSLSWLKRGRELGREFRRDNVGGAVDIGHVEMLFDIFTAYPRQCEYKQDYVNGLKGLLPNDEDYTGTDVRLAVSSLMWSLTRRSNRTWTTGGFIRNESDRPWFMASVPQNPPNCMFLSGSTHVGDVVVTDTHIENKSEHLVITKFEHHKPISIETEVITNETFRFEFVVNARHEHGIVTESKQYTSINTVLLVRYLHAILMRFGIEDRSLIFSIETLLDLNSDKDSDTSSIRRDVRRYIHEKYDGVRVSDLPLFTNQAPIAVSVLELRDLFNLTTPESALAVTISCACGCQFTMPHILAHNLFKLVFPRSYTVINLNAINPQTEYVQIASCTAVTKSLVKQNKAEGREALRILLDFDVDKDQKQDFPLWFAISALTVLIGVILLFVFVSNFFNVAAGLFGILLTVAGVYGLFKSGNIFLKVKSDISGWVITLKDKGNPAGKLSPVGALIKRTYTSYSFLDQSGGAVGIFIMHNSDRRVHDLGWKDSSNSPAKLPESDKKLI